LNARAREDAIIIVEAFEFDAPKTSQFVSLLRELGVGGKKVLVLTDGVKPNVYMSGRNVRDAQVMNYSDVSTYHILWSDVVVIESSALGQSLDSVEDTAEEAEAAPKKKTAARKSTKKTAGRKSAAKKTVAKKSAKSSAKKTTKRAAKKKGK